MLLQALRIIHTVVDSKMISPRCSPNFVILTCILLSVCTVVFGDLEEAYLKSNSITYVNDWHRKARNGGAHIRMKRQSRISSLLKEKLINEHNARRRLEYSSDMEIMTWNDQLAEMAQLWGDRCGWYHGQADYPNPPHDPVGQNLYATTGKLDINRAMTAWSDNEKLVYDYNTGECRGDMCGHYTQVVWSKSREVGCAHSHCPVLSRSGLNNAEYLVCNYGPAGNYRGQKPFLMGPACTECHSGYQWCSNGLCKSNCHQGLPECECKSQCANNGCPTLDCTCRCQDGYRGSSCGDVCKDENMYCGASPGWPRSWCNRDYVVEGCPLFCDKCKSYTGRSFPCSDVPITVTPTPPTTPTPTTPTPITTPTTTRRILPSIAPSVPPGACNHLFCSNGGLALPDGSTCSCFCPMDWMGPMCQESRLEARNGVILHTSSLSRDWERLVGMLKVVIANNLESYCNNNAADCCQGQGLAPGDRFLFSDGISTGATYPNIGMFNGEETTRILFLAKSTTLQGRCKSDLPQDIFYNALYIARGSLDTAIMKCCDSRFLSLEKAVEDPHRPSPSLPSATQVPINSMVPEMTTEEGTPMTMDEGSEGGLAIPIWLIAFLVVLFAGVLISAGICFYCMRYQMKTPETGTDEGHERY